MRDVVFILITLLFFAGAVAYTFLCERIVGADDLHVEDAGDHEPVDAAAVPQAA